jgi:xanthine dehydrogenase accessory factor
MSSLQFLEFFEKHRAAREPLVLVTVVETHGSTYSKAGHRILVAGDGNYCGLISGGCLEGDLVEHTRRVFQNGLSILVVYDLRGDDEPWGLGIGCNGSTKLLLQLVDCAHDYEPLAGIAAVLNGSRGVAVDIVTASEHPRIALGTTFIDRAAGNPGEFGDLFESIVNSADSATAESAAKVRQARGFLEGHPVELMRQQIAPVPSILVVGAGPDAVPLVAGFSVLDWRVAVVDHRASYLNRVEFGNIARHLVCNDAALRDILLSTAPAAAIVMSHNLRSDERALRVLADHDIPYVGLLGPPHRRDLLLARLQPNASSRLKPRLHAPVGAAIGADSPGSIALSILTEVFIHLRHQPARVEPQSAELGSRKAASTRRIQLFNTTHLDSF